MLDTLSQVTGVREGFRSRFGEATVALPSPGVRASQVPDRQLTADLLDIFGRPRGESACACERNEDISMTLALHLINGESIARRLADGNSKIAKLVNDPRMTDPQLILLNDPTRGIDVGTKQELYVLMRELADKGAAILFYSTDYDELIGCCDRVLILYDGRIVRSLEGAEINEHNIVASALNIASGKPAATRAICRASCG